MIAELTVQHAYIEGGDLGLPKRPFVALPGARFELDAKSGRYRIAKIFAGENEEEHYRSPLTEVGVDAHVGDYVLSINGRELKAGTDPYELLQAPANQPVEWRVASDPDGHRRAHHPLSTAAQRKPHCCTCAWVTQNRARVDRMSQGRLGYIHIPDMGEAGIREFIKWWYPQVRKEGLVVDVRDNGGGNISQMLIERLAGASARHAICAQPAATGTYPGVGPTWAQSRIDQRGHRIGRRHFRLPISAMENRSVDRQAHLGRRGRNYRPRNSARRRQGVCARVRYSG